MLRLIVNKVIDMAGVTCQAYLKCSKLELISMPLYVTRYYSWQDSALIRIRVCPAPFAFEQVPPAEHESGCWPMRTQILDFG